MEEETTESIPGVVATAIDAHEAREDSATSPEPTGSSSPGLRGHSRYPLNSRRLTALHLRTIAKALELSTTGSLDQLRQCIVQHDHDYHNIMVTIRETLRTELVITLEDSEGEFLHCAPLYRDAPARRVRIAEETHVMDDLRRQLEEAEREITAAVARDEQQAQMISELQEALHTKETELINAHEEEVAVLRQQLTTEKERARKRWKVSCEHAAEQDATITACEEEIATLKEEVRELQTCVSRGPDERRVPTMVHGIPPPEEEGPTAGQPVRQSVQPSPTGAPLTSATNLSARRAVVTMTGHTAHDPPHPPSESIPATPPPEPPDGRRRPLNLTG